MFWNKKIPVSTDEKKIQEILTRAVEDVFVKESLEKKLRSGKRLRIKFGIDPTSAHIHIGRAVVLRKLRAFQELGHTIVFLIGDFTAQIGDPSDKLEKRPMLTRERILENLRTYKKQAGKIIDFSTAEFHYNSDWLSKLGFAEIATLAESFSASQMIARRNFKDRFEKGDEISLREFMYPLMQGYDSVALKADVEIGGFDQLFNLKAGRVIQKHYGMPEQDVLTVQMLEGTDGRKMSSSWGNIIAIDDDPSDMYGKVMSLRDELIPKYFLLATDMSETYIKEIEEKLRSGVNPKELKMELAREIVKLYYGETESLKAQSAFISVFSKGTIPEDIKVISVQKDVSLRDTLVDTQIVESRSEFTRLVSAGGVQDMNTGEKITDSQYKINESKVFRIGKKRFVKIEVK